MSKLLNPFASFTLRNFLLWGLLSLPFLIIILVYIGDDETITSTISFIWFYGLIVVWARAKFKKYKINFSFLFGRLPPRRTIWKLLILVVVLVMFSFGAVMIMAYLFSFIGSNFDQKYWEAYGITNNPKTATPNLYYIIDAIAGVFFAPFFEELFFRGILLHRLATKWGVTKGVIISSALFGILHGDFVGAFIFGVIMCMVYIKTTSLFATILCHFLANLLPTALGILASLSSQSPAMPTAQENQIIGITGAVFVAIAIPVIIAAMKRMRYKNELEVLPYFVNRNK